MAQRNGIKWIYIKLCCPWQNGYAESFNGRFRRECLNPELIHTLSEERGYLKIGHGITSRSWRIAVRSQTSAALAETQSEPVSGLNRARLSPPCRRKLDEQDKLSLWKLNHLSWAGLSVRVNQSHAPQSRSLGIAFCNRNLSGF